MRSVALLDSIRSAYLASYEADHRPHEKTPGPSRRTSGQGEATAALEAAHQRLAENLRLLCTDICISGEEYVRTFPAKLFVPMLTEILAAAHALQSSEGCVTNPFSLKDCDRNAQCNLDAASQRPREVSLKSRSNELLSRCMSYTGVQVASVIEVLALRALALIADIVPRGSFAFCPRRSKDTIPTLALYLANHKLLVVNEDLLEELLKCFLYVSRVAHDACLDARVPEHTTELLLVLVPHHLRLLCVQVVSNLLSLARESHLGCVWSPVIAKLLRSMDKFLLEGTFRVGTPDTAHQVPMNGSSALAAASSSSSVRASPRAAAAAPTNSYPTLASAWSLTPEEATLLEHYMEAIAHAIDRLFVCVVSMKAHVKLLNHIMQLCVRLLYMSLRITSPASGERLRSIALSPILAFYLSNPTFAVPVMLQLRVWEAVCGCMLALVEHRERTSKTTSTPAGDSASGGEIANDPTVDNAANFSDHSSSSTLSDLPRPIRSPAVLHRGTARDGGSNAVAGVTQLGAPRPGGPALTTGPVLTTDVTTIPFIADELRLLPLLEFLLVLLPCARRGHSHTDFRNTTLPYFGWAWEDDFHNETECDELLSQRLECVYQQTRNCRTHQLFVVSHERRRVFYTDFLSKSYLNERQEHHCLHRKPFLTGYVHSTQNALLRGCTCHASHPAPLFSTWPNRSCMRFRTADIETTTQRRVPDDDDDDDTENEEDRFPAPEPAPREAAIAQASSSQLVRTRGGTGERMGGSPPSPSCPQDRPISLLQMPGAQANDSDDNGGNQNASTSQSASPRSIAASPNRGGSGDPIYAQSSTLPPRPVYSGEEEEDMFEEDYYGTANRDQNAAQLRNSRRCCGWLDILLCRRDPGATATSHRRNRRRQMSAYPHYSSSYSSQHRRSLALTVLPMEAVLEGPGERLQADPATRKAFLRKGVLSSMLSTIVPALLSVLDNCVNPVVARHSVTLLLRCLSLSADLRTQVTGEPIELVTSGSSKRTPPGATAASGVSEEKTRRLISFCKWINGAADGKPKRWQRAEWEATQAALQRFVPSLREVLVGLYVAGGVHIMAERQEVFGYLRDDALMADELARVGLSNQFSGFQLALPSEQHICTADTIGLLLSLFASPGLMNGETSVSSSGAPNKGEKTSSLFTSPRSSFRGGKDAQEPVAGQPQGLAECALRPSQLLQDGGFSVGPLAQLETSSLRCESEVVRGDPGHNVQRPPTTSLLAHVQPACSTDDNAIALISLGAGNKLPRRTSPTTPSHACNISFAQAAAKGHCNKSEVAHDRLSKAPAVVAPSGRDLRGTGFFTLHQKTLLISYASQIVRRSVMVCAAAQQIHDSMSHQVYCTRVVFGSEEGGSGGMLPARSKDLTLRLMPDAQCPYHSTFPACAETFFRASQALLMALLAAGISPPFSPRVTTSVSEDSSAWPLRTILSPVFAPAAQSSTIPRLQVANLGRQGSSTPFTAPGDEEGATTPSHSASCTGSNIEQEISVDVELSGIPATVNAAEMQGAIDSAMGDTVGVYRRLPPALRGLLGFYDYCKRSNVELRAAVVETPEILGGVATSLDQWLASRERQREDVQYSNASLAHSAFMSNNSLDTCSSPRMDGGPPSQPHLRLDSTARGKLLSLTADFATTIGRDLGLSTLDVAPSVVMKQPFGFLKRAKRLKTFGVIRYLVWRPLRIALCLKVPASANELHRNTCSTGDAPSLCGGESTQRAKPAVVVRSTELPIITDVELDDPMMSVLPTTTLSSLAEAVAAHVQLPLRTTHPTTSTRKAPKQSPAPQPMHAKQERLNPSGSGSRFPTRRKCFEGHHADKTAATATGGSTAGMPVSADRILFFVDGTPLLSPMTTLLDALTAFSASGASLRDFVKVQRGSSDPMDTPNAKITALLPTLPFWTLTHSLEFVVLSEPLPASLLFDSAGAAGSSSMTECCCCCGCDGLRPAFFCSPKHLFDAAPASGPLALYSALSTLMREEVGSSLTALESNQRRLSSAVVHELYHQLDMLMMPPLLWCSGIGGASCEKHSGPVGNSGVSLSSEAFPLPSYALWRYPFIFSTEMRFSIFKFFISAQRSLSHEQAKRLLQNFRHLLVPAAPRDEAQAATGSAAEEAQKTLNIVGLQWLSGEVARRYRVTLEVHRDDILRSAEELIRLATCNVAIDVAFVGEAGIGNGPAMEFYEMIADALVDPKHGLWRTEPIPVNEVVDSASLTAMPPPALGANPFPRTAVFGAPQPRRSCTPLFPAAKQTPTSLHYWKLLGVLLGRLLVVDRATSLSFHPLLLRRLRGESLMSTESGASRNMSQVDAALELSLQRLEMMSADTLAACALFFTIPLSEADGYVPGIVSELPLVPGGADRQVTADNVREYTHRLRNFYLHTVPDLALLHLRQGLQITVNPLYLQLFNVSELGRLLGSPQDSKIWETREDFSRNVEAAHGYHMKSDVVQYLLDVVPTWGARMQRAFLKFVTGTSAVPFGGLTQRIKVVRRDADISVADLTLTSTVYSFGASTGALATSSSFPTGLANHDNSLPTVSTCFLYLKLPNYSSKAVLQDRLRFAVCEGQGFFSLT
ncbi:hypothetical protein JKF63_00714 [Porcisia hertigi]|uniref:HECT domain-containing protein n=1 Tax=Porcisia hertigi TaxID=2761500 RepID=A0A836HZK2_9TRYP|nr:hypothetical protein JKF63_00714 [Porcisia hertigi]